MTREEFKTQFLPCHRTMYLTALRYLRNSDDAEDIVQDAYLRLWEKRESLDGIKNTEAYTTILVRNLCLDRLRGPDIIAEDYSTLTLEPEPAPPPDSEYEHKEDMKTVWRLIQQLPEQQRTILLLRGFEGKSTEEIALETKLEKTHIRVLLSRARKTVKDLFTRIR